MFKRITLFILTNLAILVAINVVLALLRAFGVFDAAQAFGSYGPLLVISAVVGFSGSIISLLISKWMAKWTTGAQVIESPRNEVERWLVDTVARHANRAGIKMPEVAVYDAPEMNAFATGPTRNNSLVAVSTGLMQQMKRDEVDAVLGHEIAHVANGDMVTLTLIQGVLNTFVFFFSRIIGNLVDSMLRSRDDDNRGPGIGYWVATFVAEIVLGILAMIIVQWFSRRREFRADEGGASLAGRGSMISALKRLSGSEPSHLPDSMAAFGITPKRQSGLMALFSSHPPIEERIARLQQSPV
ncbi:MAG TPA: protease HtpX [Polyangiaceae bacterium]|nr:protease HtpX [Polyangiaceae bacterium]